MRTLITYNLYLSLLLHYSNIYYSRVRWDAALCFRIRRQDWVSQWAATPFIVSENISRIKSGWVRGTFIMARMLSDCWTLILVKSTTRSKSGYYGTSMSRHMKAGVMAGDKERSEVGRSSLLTLLWGNCRAAHLASIKPSPPMMQLQWLALCEADIEYYKALLDSHVHWSRR